MEWINEIKSQPSALRDFTAHLKTNPHWVEKAKNIAFNKVLLTGMGSSLFACYTAAEIFKKNGIFCTAMDSQAVLESAMGLIDENTLVIAVSQSGESPEVIELTGKIENKENLVVFVNYPKSTVYNCGAVVVPILCGRENYSSSKSFTNTLASLIAFAEVIVNKDENVANEICYKLEACAKETERIFEDAGDANTFAKFLMDTESLCYVGGSYSYTSAAHMELIGEETAKIYGTRYTPSQFIHGPIELIKKGFNALLFNTQKGYYEKMEIIRDSVVTYGGKVLMITNNKEYKSSENVMVYHINCEDPAYAPIVEIVLMELIFNTIGLKKGEKPGHLYRVAKRIIV